MKIEIWSDVVCPFCYIGKRNLENALKNFEQKDQVQIAWKSFELDSSAAKNKQRNHEEYLSNKFGRSREEVRAMNQKMMENAKRAGLDYRLDLVIPTNSFDAHRLIHLADAQGVQDKAEEVLFSAFFTRGLDIADPATLVQLGEEMGLDAGAVQQMLDSDQFAEDVRREQQQASEYGIQGVPFFLIEEKYAITGAQPPESILQALQQIWQEEKGSEAGQVPSPS